MGAMVVGKKTDLPGRGALRRFSLGGRIVSLWLQT